MNHSGVEGRSAPFLHGSDCNVTFLRAVDDNNALIDLWHVVMGSGDEFFVEMMLLRRKVGTGAPFVFGTIYTDQTRRNRKWSFRENARELLPGFYGNVYTTRGADDRTYVEFESAGRIQHRLLFSALLKVPQVDSHRVVKISSERTLPSVAMEMVVAADYPVSTGTAASVPAWMPGVPVDTSVEMREFVDRVLRFM